MRSLTYACPDVVYLWQYFNSITDWCAFIPQKTALVSDVSPLCGAWDSAAVNYAC